jgi:UDPglucose 6-dehydrogenase
VTVVGGGYVGLVSAANLAALGHKVYVVDIKAKQREIDALSSDATAVPIYEPGLREMIIDGKAKGLITFSTDLEPAVKDSSIVYLAVGTPSQETGEVDLTYILKASADVGDVILKHGGFRSIVIKSTVTPDTFERMDETLRAKGLTLGKDYAPVSNPEFLREGQAIEDVTKPDRTVLGFYAALSVEDRARAEKEILELWRPLMIKHPHTVLLTDTASSTIIKYMANSFLAVSITLSNIFAAISWRFALRCSPMNGSGRTPSSRPARDMGDLAFPRTCWPFISARIRRPVMSFR